jgi:hypothetical protein
MAYVHGVPNLVRVDDNVYRSGQISTAEGWDSIATLAAGRRVHVLKLNFDSEGTDDLALARGFEVEVFAIEPQGDQDYWNDLVGAFTAPDAAIVARADALLAQAATHPGDLYLVHCTHGQDRTGYIIGRYRVLRDGWTKVRAYREMLARNFHPELHGLHEAWEQFNGKAK